jgi:dephospho-CoA kinase
MASRTRVVGLSGGIGTGKSSVARMLARLGALVVDADAIVHELQAPGTPLLAALVEAFGPGILTAEGALDRKALADLVFSDAKARECLNRLVHPAVGAEMLRRVAEARARGVPLVVLDIPLLFETRARGGAAAASGAELAILVYAPEALQIARTMSRDGCSREAALARVRAQLPIEEKRALADVVIDNSGSLDDTERQVRALFASLVSDPQPAAPAASRGRTC